MALFTGPRYIWVVLLIALPLINSPTIWAQPQKPPELPPGEYTEFILSGEDHHLIELEQGDFLNLSIKSDAKLNFHFQDGMGNVSSQAEGNDVRRIFHIAKTQGPYTFTVIGPRGSCYSLMLKPPSAADEKAAQRIDAWRLLREGIYLSTDRGHDPEQVLGLLDETLTVWETHGETALEALALTHMGIAARKLGRFAVAADYLERAIPRFTLLEETNLFAISGLYLAGIHAILGYFNRAESLTIQVATAARKLNNPRLEATALNDRARARRQMGLFQNTLDLLEQANLIWGRLDDSLNLARGLINSGDYLTYLGQYAPARDQFERAMFIAERMKNRHLIGNIELGAGWTWYRQGDYDSARPKLERALAVFKNAQLIPNQITALERLAILEFSSGQLHQAEELIDEAEALAIDLKSPLDQANLMSSRGFLHLEMNRFQSAEMIGAEVVKWGEKLDNPPMIRRGLYLQAQAKAALGELVQAKDLLQPVVDNLESTRLDFDAFGMRGAFTHDRQEFYNLYLSLCMRLHQSHPKDGYDTAALTFIEKTRGRSLLEGINAEPSKDADLLHEMEKLQELMTNKEHARRKLPKTQREGPAGHALERDLRTDLMRYDRLRFRLLPANEDASQSSPRLDIDPHKLFNSMLDQNTLLLIYALCEKESYLWAVDNKNVRSFVLPAADKIRKQAWDYYQKVSVQPTRLSRGSTETAADELAKTLLHPLEKLNLTEKTRLVLMNDDILHRIPFGALRFPGDDKRLIERFEIASIPSLSVLKERRHALARRPAATSEIAVFADPVFRRDDSRINHAKTLMNDPSRKRILELDRLMRLPATAVEAQAIASVFKQGDAIVVTDFEANLNKLMSINLASYRLLHFATHGLDNAAHPELAGLVLSMVDSSGGPVPGFLHTHTIERMQLSAELVVLSACQTAGQKEVAGEGLVGLSGGFLKAGAGAVVVSLWNVNDTATAEIMGHFYRGMETEGLTPIASLGRAQAKMLKSSFYASPYYWAGFVHQGDYQKK